MKLTAGSYNLSFYAAQRGNHPGNSQTLQVLVDGSPVAIIKPLGGSTYTHHTVAFTVTAGMHTIAFAALVNSDSAVFLDGVAISLASGE